MNINVYESHKARDAVKLVRRRIRHVGWCGPPVPPLRRLLAEVTRRGPALGRGGGTKAPRHMLLGAGGQNGRGATRPSLLGGSLRALHGLQGAWS